MPSHLPFEVLYNDSIALLNKGMSYDEKFKLNPNDIQLIDKASENYERGLKMIGMALQNYRRNEKLANYQRLFSERLQELSDIKYRLLREKSSLTRKQQDGIFGNLKSWWGRTTDNSNTIPTVQKVTTPIFQPYRQKESAIKIYQQPMRPIDRSNELTNSNYSTMNKHSPLKPNHSSKARAKNLLSHPSLKGVDKSLLKCILDDIVNPQCTTDWNEIAGLHDAKQCINESVILPSLRPDLFQGIRTPPRGVLFFGPPGTGKTLLAKAIASQCKSTFFSISASSLTSKYVGNSEKMVKALFAAANFLAPSVIFFDEIDSILTKRSEDESDSTRRLKTEFLVQLDGVNSHEPQNRVLLIGATNLPYEIDEAGLRRFQKKIYIPLPDYNARKSLLKQLLFSVRSQITESEVSQISKMTIGYSGSDLTNLAKEASMQCIRELPPDKILNVRPEKIRPVVFQDFKISFGVVKPSTSPEMITKLESWAKKYG